jgi:hypothetical protein
MKRMKRRLMKKQKKKGLIRIVLLPLVLRKAPNKNPRKRHMKTKN